MLLLRVEDVLVLGLTRSSVYLLTEKILISTGLRWLSFLQTVVKLEQALLGLLTLSLHIELELLTLLC